MKDKQPPSAVKLSNFKIACKQCALRELCLPLGLDNSEIDELDNIFKKRRFVKKREYLYRMGEPMKSLYAIRSGSLKTAGLMEDGRVQVVGFHLPGELVGFDAISDDRYNCDAISLEDTELCEIPYDKLEDVARHIPGLQHQLMRMMSRVLVQEESQLMMLGKMNADERLASYLLSISRRQRRLGCPEDTFRLTMSRQDIADYIGLALETVSRLFSRFQEDGMISVQGREIKLLDQERLKQLTGHTTRIKTGNA